VTIDELWQEIVAAGREHDYVLRDVAMPEHQPSSVTVLEPAADDSGRWVVYFSERGQILDPEYYDSEAAACDAVHARLTRPPNPTRTLSAEEEERARQLGEEAERHRRRLLIDAGYDPDTMRPLG
jgi:hypothetical protein